MIEEGESMRNPNGYGSVHKIGGTKKRRNPWRVRVTDGWILDEKGNARQKYRSIGYFPDRKSALQALAEYNKNPLAEKTAKLTFADVYEMWSKEHFPKISKSAQEGYKSALKNSYPLHNIKIADIRTVHLKEVMDSVTPGVKSRLKTFWGLIFKYALEHDMISKNYADFISVRLTDEEKHIKKKAPFSDDEIKKLWDSVGKIPGTDYILILCYTGMRPSELLGIKIEDINLRDRLMVGGIKTASGKNRFIPIHKKILPLIESKVKNGQEMLIENNGKKMSYDVFLNRVWRPAMQELNMGHTPHECRHTGISLMRAADIERDTIKLIVGHSSGDVTDRYIHVKPQMLVEAIDKIK